MKVGIIGLGLQGTRMARAVKNNNDIIVTGATDKIDQRAEHFSKNFGCEITDNWRDIVKRKEIESVIICTPPNLHAQIAIEALKNRKHVLCEKPPAINLKEAEMILKEVEKTGLKLKYGFNLHYHPAISRAKEMVDDGTIGEIMFLRCVYGMCGREGYETDWRMKKEISGGGELMDQGIHIVDLSRWFLGNFVEVFASLGTNFWQIKSLEDNVFFILKTAKEQHAFCQASWTQWKNLFSLEIYGKEGYVAVNGLGGSYGPEKLIYGKRDFKNPFKQEIIKFLGEDKSWLEQWREFSLAIKENRQPLSNANDGFEVLEVIEALYQSAQKKKVIKLT